VLLPEAFEDQFTEAAPGTAAGQVGQSRGTEPVGGAGDAGAAVFDLDQIERHAIERALVATGGNRTKASKLLGISERTLRNKLNVPRAEVTSDT
jgi:DNA-binding NtrC family response regulator